jgi:hypothetical protein
MFFPKSEVSTASNFNESTADIPVAYTALAPDLGNLFYIELI